MIVPVVAWLFAASPAYASSSVPYSELQLGSPNATRSYGQATITGSNAANCSSSSDTFQTTASLSADSSGNGLLTIGTQNLGNQPHSVTAVSGSELELDFSGSGPDGKGVTYMVTSTLTGYGTSFTGTYVLTISSSEGSCTFTRPQTLTLQGTGLTLGAAPPPNGGGSPQQEVNSAATGLEQSVDGILNESVKSTIQNITTSIDPGAPGTVDATVVFDGTGGSGSSFIVFEGGTGQGSSLLVFDGSTGQGSSLLVFDGGTGQGSSIFAPCSSDGDGYVCTDGSGGSGSSVLTFEGSGGSGSSILAPPTEGPRIGERHRRIRRLGQQRQLDRNRPLGAVRAADGCERAAPKEGQAVHPPPQALKAEVHDAEGGGRAVHRHHQDHAHDRRPPHAGTAGIRVRPSDPDRRARSRSPLPQAPPPRPQPPEAPAQGRRQLQAKLMPTTLNHRKGELPQSRRRESMRIPRWVALAAVLGALAFPGAVSGKSLRCCYDYVGTISQHNRFFDLNLMRTTSNGSDYQLQARWRPDFSPAKCANAFLFMPQTTLKATVHIPGSTHQFVIKDGVANENRFIKVHKVKNFTAVFTKGRVTGSFANDTFLFHGTRCSTGPIIFSANIAAS